MVIYYKTNNKGKTMDVLNQLSTIYNDWLDDQKINDRASADELYICHNLTDVQKNWLKLFIEVWDQAEDFQSYIDKLFIKKIKNDLINKVK